MSRFIATALLPFGLACGLSPLSDDPDPDGRETHGDVGSSGAAASPADPSADGGEHPADNPVVQRFEVGVQPGDELVELRLVRIRRPPAELRRRLVSLARIVWDVDRRPARRWARDALRERFDKHVSSPFGADAGLVVEYFPHTDGLTIHRVREMPLDAERLSLSDARARAEELVVRLVAAGLVEGRFVLGNSSSQVTSVRDVTPFAQNHIFDYYGLAGSELTLHRHLQLAVGPEGAVDRVHVAWVDVSPTGRSIGAERSLAETRRRAAAQLDRVAASLSPVLRVAGMSDPFPTYVLPRWEDEAALLPVGFVRYAFINGSGATSQSELATIPFVDEPVLTELTRDVLSVSCRAFAPGAAVAEVGERLVVDSLYWESFDAPGDPLERCERVRFLRDGAHAEVRGIRQHGLLSLLGLEDGDFGLRFCDLDGGTADLHSCVHVDSVADLSLAFKSASEWGSFLVSALRPGAGVVESRVSLASCPRPDGEPRCDQL